MNTAQVLARRRGSWVELESQCALLERRQRPGAANAIRFAHLYRSVCSDLAMAETYQLPPETVAYLHQLVSRAHNQLYRGERFRLNRWLDTAFRVVPQRIYHDHYVKVAFILFWGLFLIAGVLAWQSQEFAERIAGPELLSSMEEMHGAADFGRGGDESFGMTSFYIWHNASIGLRCFAFGLIYGVGGLLETATNALVLGTVFGYMARMPQPTRDKFFEFVTAHGPFELTAIVLSAAVGMRLGFSLISTGGLSRTESLRRAASEAMPVVMAGVVLFMLAALIEGFISPSNLPYLIKALVGAASAGLMLFYFLALGPGRDALGEDDDSATEAAA